MTKYLQPVKVGGFTFFIMAIMLIATIASAAKTAQAVVVGNQEVINVPVNASNSTAQALLWLPDTYTTDNATTKYPLIINLHGAGDAGTDINKMLNPALLSRLIADGFKPEAVNPIDGVKYKFIVLSPQHPSWSYSYAGIKAMIPYMLSNYRVDSDRVYITGLSAGGQGAWTAVTDDATNSINIAAIAPMSAATLDNSQVPNVVNAATNNIGVWSFMGSLDGFLGGTVDYTNRVNNATPPPVHPAKLTTINGVGHSAWLEGFDQFFRVNGMNMFEWMLTNKKGTANPSNTLPTVSLISPTDRAVVVVPQNIVLNATATDADGSISKVDFYNGANLIGTATTSPYSITWVNPGVGYYSVFARATDNMGAVSNSDTVHITVLAQANTSAPYKGIIQTIPGTIQAEDYDMGGQGIAYNDTNPENTGNWYRPYEGADVELVPSEGSDQYYLGWPSPTEWTKYTVNVTQSGTYTLQVRTATPNTGKSFRIEMDGTTVATVAVNPSVDWNTYQTQSIPNISLTAGQHVMRIYDITDGFNLNWLSFTYNSAPGNQIPVANAGVDQSITLPTNSVTLSGSGTDSDGTIASYTWSQVSGPSTATITTPSSSSTTVSGLVLGTYTFRLAITDNQGGVATDDMMVTVTGSQVSTPYGGTPVSIPGTIQAENYDSGGQNVAYSDTTTTNSGGAFRTNEGVDIESTPDGTYDVGWTVAGEWMKYTVNVSTAGTYTFQSRLSSPNIGKGFSVEIDGTTIATITVPNTGGWQTYQTVNTPNIFLTAGQHVMRILIGSASTTEAEGFNINWFSFTNLPPTANAGLDQTIQLPTNSVTLTGSGTDSDGTIASYAWSKVSGTGTITSPSAATTTITGLTQGTSTFRLTVTDNSGGSATDDVIVTVNAQSGVTSPYTGGPYTIPGKIEAENYDFGGQGVAYNDTSTANSGNAYRKTEGVDIESTPDGTYDVGWTVAGEWMKYTVNVSTAGTYNIQVRVASPYTGKSIRLEMDGATVATVSIPKTGGYQAWQTVTVSNISLTQGTHILRIYDVTDGFNLNWLNFVSSSTPVNQNPTANAGLDQTIQLPTNSVTLTGSGTDPDGTIASYAWSETFGPNNVTISTPSSATTVISNLVQGSYIFQLTVTDNGGATAIDTIGVTVNAAPVLSNQNPTANAGLDQTIQLPTNSVTLTGSGTDSDGTIASYAWSKVSGTGTITSPSAATTTITGLTQGTSTFRLTVTDNSGGSATDDVIVTVNAGSVYSAKTIVILGSSTAAGYGITPSSDSWVNKYATFFDNLAPGNTVVNLAVGGYTTYNVLPTGTTVPAGRPTPDTTHNITTAFSYNPAAIIVNMPSNDAASDYTLAEQQANYATLYNAAVSANVPIWFTTTQPRDLSQAQRDNLTTMRDWIFSTYGTHSVDFFTTVANTDGTINSVYGQGDGVHLNNAGHAILYDRVVEKNIPQAIYGVTNQLPIANAGLDQTIQLPTNSVTLTGSGTDSDGTIASYAWTQMSGPSTATIVTSTTAATSVSGLIQGAYTFRLTVADNNGGAATDDVVITVNSASSISKTYLIDFGTINPTTVTGWNNITNPNTGSPASLIDSTGLATSTTLQVTDAFYNSSNQNGTTGSSLYPATATGDSFFLGTLSNITENSATIVIGGLNNTNTYDFRFYASRLAGDSANRTTDYSIGTTTVSLNATDNVNNYVDILAKSPSAGLITITITKNASAIFGYLGVLQIDEHTASGSQSNSGTNLLPTANAGLDQTIQLPTASVSLSGSGTDPDGTISSYSWSQVGGPVTGSFSAATSAVTTVSGLSTAGTYTFRLTVTDNSGATATDDVIVTVNAANVLPSANAGLDQTIQLPTNSVTLSGSGTDSDGTIASYAWSKVSGTGTITSPSAASTTVTGLTQGTSTFQLLVTDNQGGTGVDTVVVTVQAANVPPAANAGLDQTVQLPINSVTLSGAGVDTDGTIASYLWTKISGSGTITSPSAATTTITGLTQGTSTFRLTVTDNSGATATDDVIVTVNAANVSPSANAGIDQTITLPTASVSLSGSGTDPDGTISSYSWSQVGGPVTGTIATPSAATTTINGLSTAGTYTFRLTVTDNSGGSATDDVIVTVNAANVSPVIASTSGITAITLSGAATDADGTIASYAWTQISGNPATIATPASASTAVTGLTPGTYLFRLTVTDNQGALTTKDVPLTIN